MGRANLDRIDDWLFGSRIRRGLLEVLTREPSGSWTQAQLARRVGAADKGTVEAPLHRLSEVGIARRQEDGRWSAGENARLLTAIRALLDELERAAGGT